MRREHVGRAGRRRGAGRGGSLPHPAGPCPAVAGVSRVSAGLRGRHRPAWLWVSGRAVLSAASGMVRSPSFCADRSRAPARRTGQQFQRLPSPLAGAAAGLRRGRVSGCAGHPAVSGSERRAVFFRHSANWQRIPPAPGLLRHRFLGAGTAFRPGSCTRALYRRAERPARPAAHLLICLLRGPFHPAAARTRPAVRPLHHGVRALHPARRPGHTGFGSGSTALCSLL